MNAAGASFQPELIELMKTVLDDATAMLPEAKRTSAIKPEIASYILTCAARGERDPVAAENGRPFSRGRLYALFARYLDGAPGRLSEYACSGPSRSLISGRVFLRRRTARRPLDFDGAGFTPTSFGTFDATDDAKRDAHPSRSVVECE